LASHETPLHVQGIKTTEQMNTEKSGSGGPDRTVYPRNFVSGRDLPAM
jgi:hypothetical protein